MRVAILTTDDRQTFCDYGCSEPRYEKAQQALIEGFARIPEVEVHVISCLQRAVRSPTKLAENIWCHSLMVPKLGWLRTGYQGCIRAIRTKLRQIKPDIVHGQGTERECSLSAAVSGFPNVVTVHGNMRAVAQAHSAKFGSYYWFTAKLEPWILRRTGGVFCNSAYTEEQVKPYARQKWRVSNALRLAFFERPRAFTNRGVVPVLLNVGVLSSYKRQLEILGVARRLWQRDFKFEMHFAGVARSATAYDAEFIRQIAEAEKDGFARHIGILNLDDLIGRLDAASAMVHFPAEESFGLVVGEALTRNLKLFASAVGGIPDITADVSGTVLCGRDDWGALENQIAAWLADGCPSTESSGSIMRDRYHPETIARRHLEIYREVLDGLQAR